MDKKTYKIFDDKYVVHFKEPKNPEGLDSIKFEDYRYSRCFKVEVNNDIVKIISETSKDWGKCDCFNIVGDPNNGFMILEKVDNNIFKFGSLSHGPQILKTDDLIEYTPNFSACLMDIEKDLNEEIYLGNITVEEAREMFREMFGYTAKKIQNSVFNKGYM